MAENEVEKIQNLINACRERLEQAEKDLNTTQKEKNEILARETKIKKEIKTLKQSTTITKINAEELYNELCALDGNTENAAQGEPGFGTYMLDKEDTIDREFRMRRRTTEVNTYLGKLPMWKVRSPEYAKKDFAGYLFEFETVITTKVRTYTLRFDYRGQDSINGKPLFSYLRMRLCDPLSEGIYYAWYGFDENFYKDLKIKISLPQVNEYPTLETAVMNILKRHEQTENVE